jgi:hypothetical protein
METQPTHVVNVKVANIRPTYANLKEWMGDENNVYVGRKGIVFIDGERFPKENSIFANPYKISGNDTREIVISKYRTYIVDKIKDDRFKTELMKLKGKNLGCWCAPEMCHANVLVYLMH